MMYLSKLGWAESREQERQKMTSDLVPPQGLERQNKARYVRKLRYPGSRKMKRENWASELVSRLAH